MSEAQAEAGDGFVIDLQNLNLTSLETVAVEVDTGAVAVSDVGAEAAILELLQSRPDPMGAFLPQAQISELGAKGVQGRRRHVAFLTPIVAGELELSDGPTQKGTAPPFRPDAGSQDVCGDRDHMYLIGDRFLHARKQLTGATVTKGAILGSVPSFYTITPAKVSRHLASKAQKLAYEGASLLIDVQPDTEFGDLDDAVAPHPTTLLEAAPLDASLREVSELLETHGRSLRSMRADDWVAFQSSSDARTQRLKREGIEKPKASPAKQRAQQFVLPIDLSDRPLGKGDHTRLESLGASGDDHDEAVDAHVWTLTMSPTVEEVDAARNARAQYAVRLTQADAKRVMKARARSQQPRTVQSKLVRHSQPLVIPKLSMVAEDVPLPDDEGLEDDSVAENMDGAAALTPAASDGSTEAPLLLGATRTLADLIATVTNACGFSIDAAERDTVGLSIHTALSEQAATRGDMVDRLVEFYVAKGLKEDSARLVAVDELINKAIAGDAQSVVLDVAFECMLILLHKSAKMSRPLVKRLNPRWGNLFTLNVIMSQVAGEASLIEYVSRTLADLDVIQTQDSALQLALEYKNTYRQLVLLMSSAVLRDDVARSVLVLQALVEDSSAPVWIGLKPDPEAEVTIRLSESRTGTVTQTYDKSAPLKIAYDTEAIVDQALPDPESRPLAVALSVVEMTEGPVATASQAHAVSAPDLKAAKASALKAGLSKGTSEMIDHADEAALYALVGRHIPAYMTLLMVHQLTNWQVAAFEKSKALTTIMDVRKRADRVKLANVAVPGRLSRHAGVNIANARSAVMFECYRFFSDVHAAGGTELLNLFDSVYAVLNKKVSEEEEVRILEARREAVKTARQKVYQTLPSDLQWMYQELKDQGIVDVARDAVMEEEGEGPTELEVEQLDTYDNEDFSGDEH